MVEFGGSIESISVGDETYGIRFRVDDLGSVALLVPSSEFHSCKPSFLVGDPVTLKIETEANKIEVIITKA